MGGGIHCVSYVYRAYVSISCWSLSFECDVHVSDGFPKNEIWVGVVRTIQVFTFYIWKCINFAKPITARYATCIASRFSIRGVASRTRHPQVNVSMLLNARRVRA